MKIKLNFALQMKGLRRNEDAIRANAGIKKNLTNTNSHF